MKFLVDSLPYYHDFCPFRALFYCKPTEEECPRHWDKEKVCSESNPHECEWMKENFSATYVPSPAYTVINNDDGTATIIFNKEN